LQVSVKNSKPRKPSAPKAAPERRLRADASRNRERLLAAAEAVFLERGADASLDDIAKHAQVGIGTLYRHFPTREALLAAACDERLSALAQHSRARADDVSAGEALCAFLETLVRHACTYRGLATSLGIVLKNGSPGCHATTEEGRRLLALAQQRGEIREDIAFDDVVCMATAISLAAAQEAAGSRRIDKLVAMFVDGLRARATAKSRGAARARR